MMKGTKMNFKPLGDRILIERNESEEKTASGLIIPDTAQEKPLKGVVVAAGPGRISERGELITTTVQVGDTVIFTHHHVNEIVIEDEKYIIMEERNIVAIVEEENNG